MFEQDVDKIIGLSKYFANPQISLHPIRRRQDEKLTLEIINSANRKLRKNNAAKVKDPLFFVGSVDFMVKNQDDKKTYYILEANGGNSRGFSALPMNLWKKANSCYLDSLSFVKSDKPVIVISHPNKDLLLYEKIILAEDVLRQLQKIGNEAEIIHVDNLTATRLKEGSLVIIGPYKKVLPRLNLCNNNFVYFNDKKVDVLMGDGIARRKPEIIERLSSKSLKTLVINDMFLLTDDKALTYLAVEQSRDMLKLYNVEPIAFRRAKNRSELLKTIPEILKSINEVLIKPHGGSGGSGIDILTSKSDPNKKIESSISHYAEKFGAERNPYPYTICQRVEASPIFWRNAYHHFDIRVYVGRLRDEIVPIGALMRIALEPFSGHFSKKSFVVNLSGYEGVDTDRGFGLHEDSLKLLSIDKPDFVNMFSSACALIAYMNNNYKFLMKKSMDAM